MIQAFAFIARDADIRDTDGRRTFSRTGSRANSDSIKGDDGAFDVYFHRGIRVRRSQQSDRPVLSDHAVANRNSAAIPGDYAVPIARDSRALNDRDSR